MSFLIVNTPFPRSCAIAFHLHFFSNRGIRLHPQVAGNFPRIPGVTPGLCLVHYPLLSVTHRSALLVQSGRLAPPPRLPVVERRTTCPSSDGTTRDQDGSCSKDRRACRSPWTTQVEGPTTRELAPPRINSATRSNLTVPCSSLSLIRFVFRRRLASHCYSPHSVFSRASHLAAGRVSDILVKRRSDKIGSQVRQLCHQLRELRLLCK
jgi:hypothetical protein